MNKGNMKKSFTSQRFRSGMYSSVLTVVVIAVVILLNLMFAKLDLSTDLSQNGLFTLSADTVKVLDEMKQDVTLYYMVQDGNETSYIEEILKRYEKEGSHIKLVKRDPVVYQAFMAQYSQTAVSDNDVLVVNDKTDSAMHVQNTSMLYTDYTNYYTTGATEEILDVEGQITAAILNVTAESKVKMYVLAGHEEISLGESFQATLAKRNIETGSLTLTEDSGVPEDCDVLLINGPGTDLLESEIEALEEYLDNGGRAVILADNFNIEIPNFEKMLADYGIELVEGQIIDAESCSYYVNYIVPQIDTAHEITSNLSGSNSVFVYAQGLAVKEDARASLTITPFLSTTDSSFSRTDFSVQDVEKQQDDIDGPFNIGLTIEEETDNGTMQIALFGSHYMIMDNVINSAPANQEIFLNAVNWMSEIEVPDVSVAPKTLSYSSITITQGSVLFWAAVLILVLPGGLLIAGFIIWWLRRRS